MKKLVFIMVALLGLGFISCGTAEKTTDNTDSVNDTTVVDSTVVDSIAVDSVK